MRIRFKVGSSMLACDHWQQARCAKGLHDGEPTVEQCFACDQYEGPARGAGDVVAKAIDAVTFGKVKKCGGCNKRQVKLNAVVPFTEPGGTIIAGRAGAEVEPWRSSQSLPE